MTAGRRGRRGDGRRTVGGAVAAFAAAGLAAVLVIGVAVLWIAQRNATVAAVADARDLTVAEGDAAVAPVLTDGLPTREPSALAALDAVVRRRILSTRVVRVKVWAADGTILYSDQPSLIGRRFQLGADELRALAGGPPEAEVSDLNRPENVLERPFHKLLEVYDRVQTPSGQPVLYEAYLRFSSVTADSHRTLTSMVPALLFGLALLFVVQVPLAWSLARRVDRARDEERRMLRRALDAGEIERRHIAADLHDGVVQALVGASLSLSASAGEASRAGLVDVSTRVDKASGELRQAVRDLRSLIVAIAPPRLHEEGLNAALADLVSPLASRGVDAALHVDDDLELTPETELLLYRTAQEAVRNVTRHARATHVDVGVRRTDGHVQLSVRDDGVGFSPADAVARHAEGHVGLHLLAELASEAGGRLEIAAEPGAGTHLSLEVPAQ